MTPDPKRWKALAVLGVAYLMVVLDISIVNVALPSIQDRSRLLDRAACSGSSAGYALTFGGFLLLGGRSGDLLGRRKVFMAGLAPVRRSSRSSAALASSAAMLDRVPRSARARPARSSRRPSSRSRTVTFEEGAERNKALGVLGAIAGSGAAIGVLLGGVLTEYAGWEWIFFVNVPIGLLAAHLRAARSSARAAPTASRGTSTRPARSRSPRA